MSIRILLRYKLMAKITRIKTQKSVSRRSNRVNVYFDGKFAFGLDVDNLLKVGLKVGQELTDKEIKDLIFKNEFQKYLDKVLRFISLRPRSEKEVKDYLKRKLAQRKTTAFLVEKILARLKELGVLNDREFALWWLEQRSTFRPRGKFALKAELRQKGIDNKVIREVLEQELDEVKLAKKAIQKKLKIYKRLSAQERYQKLSALLSRRGFSWETIRKVLGGH